MLRITDPVHGAVLNHRLGRQTETGLEIVVRGTSGLRDRVSVNGIPADRSGEGFEANLLLTAPENDIVAISTGPAGRQEHVVRVVWDRYSRPRYRFSIDDNSFFLRDIAARRPPSLFACPYLDALRRVHDTYGTKFCLNLFFETPEADFQLPEFPDTYRGEWADNADWLKLSFHAYAEFPNRPYQYASDAKLAADFDLVAEEILRFAGAATWSPPTVIHWAMLQPGHFSVLADRGVKVLSGFFVRRDEGLFDINYQLDDARSAYLSQHDALKDFDSGIVLSSVDIVVNNTPLDQIEPTLEPLTQDPRRAEIMDVFTHEQYSWPFYERYVPDHTERIEAAARFCTEHGYEPVFFHEGLLGGRE